MTVKSSLNVRQWLLRAAKIAGALVVLLIAVVVTLVEIRWDRTFDAALPELQASTDSSVIARGRYLAQGPAHCVECHSSPASAPNADPNVERALSGGRGFEIPGGMAYAPNLTNDTATGIGRLSDGQIARALRYGVGHDGRALIPYMEFQQISDSDVVALLSYLRAQPAIANAVPAHRFKFVAKALMAFVIKPPTLEHPPLAQAPAGVGRERGEYLVNEVANCAGCHTARNQVGAYVGAPLAGGLAMSSEKGDGMQFVTPNLTPDANTGRIAQWSVEQFIARLRAGRIFAGSPMPWEAFSRMSDDDLRSIYAYLRSVPAVANQTGESARHVAAR